MLVNARYVPNTGGGASLVQSNYYILGEFGNNFIRLNLTSNKIIYNTSIIK